MRFQILVGAGILAAIALTGCGTSSPTLATVGNERITLADFEDSYIKNNGGRDSAVASSLSDRQRYLDLLVKFRMKVQEARQRGLDRDSSIREELDMYRASVAQAYLVEREMVNPAIRRAYERQKEQVRASHILIRVAPNARAQDTLGAWGRAMGVIGQIPREPFDSLARRNSEDPSAATNGGDLGYFGGGRMVPEFEDAAFALKPGEYTKTPIRTQFGYHIIKVTERRPNPGSVGLAHVLLRFAQDGHDSVAVRDTAMAVYAKLKQGLPFAEAVRQHSQDPQSVPRGGEIGVFEIARLPLPLQELLKNVPADSLVAPLWQPYGFHLIKVLQRKPVPPFAEIEKSLRDSYEQQRRSYDYRQYVNALAKKYEVLIDSATLAALENAFDTTKVSPVDSWADTLSAALRARTLVKVAGRPTTVQEFVDRANGSNQYHPQVLKPQAVRAMIPPLIDALVIEQHGRDASASDPMLVDLMKQYEEGILLYRVDQDEVWKKLPITDSLLHVYYDAHKDAYQWPDRVNVAEIFVGSDSLVNVCVNEIRKTKDFGAVAKRRTVRQQYAEKMGEWGLLPVSTNELTVRAAAMAVDSVSAPFRYQNGWSIVKTVAKEPARGKTFEEAKPEVMSAYQDIAAKQREQEWVEELRKKYPVTIDTDLLTQAFKKVPTDAH
jgi:peptidyl-prolyl cis-trans isomerase SurA